MQPDSLCWYIFSAIPLHLSGSFSHFLGSNCEEERGIPHSPQEQKQHIPDRGKGWSQSPGRKQGLAGGACPDCALWDSLSIQSISGHITCTDFLLSRVFYNAQGFTLHRLLILTLGYLCHLVSFWLSSPFMARGGHFSTHRSNVPAWHIRSEYR